MIRHLRITDCRPLPMLSFIVDCMSFAPTGMAVRAAPKLARPAVVMSASLVEVSSCTRAAA